MSELRPERLEVLVGREVALGLGPGGDRVDDPVDELLDAALPLRRPDMTTEVLADDDVRGQLAPEGGDLDVGLLEDGLARLAGDVGSPELPGDLVVRMDVRGGPEGPPSPRGPGPIPDLPGRPVVLVVLVACSA